MQKSTSNKFVAQGAEAWQEKEIHDQIISDLNDVWGKQDSYFQINGYVYAWYVKVLPETRLLEIVNRGRHDEIMYMIKRYQQANCPPEKRSFFCSREADFKKRALARARLFFCKKISPRREYALAK